MKFVHAADLHLDSPLRGIQRYEGAPVDEIRGATRRALVALVDLCVEESVELLVIAGDLYDGDWKDYSTGLFFAAQMARLQEASVRVVFIRGNHDAASKLTKHLKLPENVQELRTYKPETVVLEDLDVAIHGQGFAEREVTEDLSAAYPAPIEGAFNLGLLHTALDGREGHAPYAPCKLEGLVGRGYDYWALGHVHAREVLSEAPHVVFPGNLQGRHARETGPKGATLVEVEGGSVARLEARVLDVVRWERLVVDAAGLTTVDDVVERASVALRDAHGAAGGRTLVARVEVSGACAADGALRRELDATIAELRAQANEVGGDGVFLEKVELRTRPLADLQQLARRDDPIGEMLRTLGTLRDDEAALGDLAEDLADLKKKLPPELRVMEDGRELDSVALVRDALEDVERELLPRLLAKESDG